MRIAGVLLLVLIIAGATVLSVVIKYDVERVAVNRQVALLKAQTELEDVRTEKQIKLIEAQERLEKAKTKNDPSIREAVKHAEKVKLYLSAWLPVYLPFVLSAAVGGSLAVYISFRLVEFQHGELKTPVRAIDVPKLAMAAMQVQYAEATQGVDAVKFASELQARNMTALGTFARGLRGVLGSREAPAMQTHQHSLPSVVYPVPTFAESLNDMRPGKVLIGYDKGVPVHLDESDFVSCGLAGAAGSGKTTKERFLFCQLAIHGVRLPVLDAHSGHPQSLVSSLGDITKLPNVTVYSPIDTRETIQFFRSDLETALKHPEQMERTIYVIEELLPIVDTVPETANFILKAATEGRKFERFVFAAGQVWPASLFQKGSCVRDSLTLRMSAKNDELQARLLFKTKEKAKIVEGLQLSQMFVNSMKFQGVVDVPFCTRDDMNALAAKYLSPAAAPNVTAEENAEIKEVDDNTLIREIKARYPENNDLARKIGYDKAQVSRALNGGLMSRSLRQAFCALL